MIEKVEMVEEILSFKFFLPDDLNVPEGVDFLILSDYRRSEGERGGYYDAVGRVGVDKAGKVHGPYRYIVVDRYKSEKG